ncbi:MAG TPA: family 1 glycosylhydrolase [Actinomycetota bacterium]|nr:family 1 glycosylhydrolase [Actinomycetota bacterium]
MRSIPPRRPPELWAGPECSHNRVGNRSFDQLERTGHARRIEDLELIAALGVRTVRYPVLWERVMDDVSGKPDWTWTDERLGRLRELGLNPVAGLLHHGNGPKGTNLLDPRFPELFAAFARQVAERYPWIPAYIPINEPLTTARFAGLYGIWFPHRRDHESFVRILLHQLQATVLAMSEIREVNPEAELVQNEDIGRIAGTPALAERAAYENERRWLTFDLLCGRFDERSPMWNRALRWGATEEQLRWFQGAACPPDVIGVDHYLTSDRLLDERLDRYPEWAHGGEDGRRWADIEAVRVIAEEPGGVLGVLRAAWDRFGLPLAVTEAHLGCTREEQMRWLQECWDAAMTLSGEGVDVRAVCVWMLFGGYDWNTLMTSDTGFYEPGAFDLRSGLPRSTGVAEWTRDIATKGRSEHPVLGLPGWWRRPERLVYPAVNVGSSTPDLRREERPRRPLLVLGEPGPLMEGLRTLCDVRGLNAAVVESSTTTGSIERLVGDAWAVIDAGSDQVVVTHVAETTRRHHKRLVSFSSHHIFSGRRGSPFVESDEPGHNEWARRERLVLDKNPEALIVRTGPLFGGADPSENHDSPRWIGLASPTYLPDAVNEALDLLVDGEKAVWHVANRGSVRFSEFTQMCDAISGLVRPRTAVLTPAEQGASVDTSLTSERGSVLPALEDALIRYVGVREHRGFPVVTNEWLAAAAAELRIDTTSTPSSDPPAHVPTSTRLPVPDGIRS